MYLTNRKMSLVRIICGKGQGRKDDTGKGTGGFSRMTGAGACATQMFARAMTTIGGESVLSTHGHFDLELSKICPSKFASKVWASENGNSHLIDLLNGAHLELVYLFGKYSSSLKISECLQANRGMNLTIFYNMFFQIIYLYINYLLEHTQDGHGVSNCINGCKTTECEANRVLCGYFNFIVTIVDENHEIKLSNFFSSKVTRFIRKHLICLQNNGNEFTLEHPCYNIDDEDEFIYKKIESKKQFSMCFFD